MDPQHRETIRRRLADEVGRLSKEAPYTVALAYPSPYAVGMSSLGFQSIYRVIMESAGLACERAFADELPGGGTVTYETLRPISAFPVVAVSVAYELELAGLVRMMDAAGIPARRVDRDERHPFVLAGGPLTFSNPTPLVGLVDAIVMGESESLIADILYALRDARTREEQLRVLAAMPNVCVPEHHGERLASIAKADDENLPAWAPMRTPHAEFSDMFLVESERGCSRACQYCVMRRSTNGGMRVVPKERVLELVPEGARRVGLVGAAVSDHPRIVEIVRALAERGAEVGLSSLRPDRLSDDFVGALRLAGYRTLTTAMDGPSERLRESLERRAREKHLANAAEMARKYGMARLKLYLMIGLPGETDADIDECVAFVGALSQRIPVALGIAPFCAKRNTPLDGAPFAGIDVVSARLDRLRRGLRGRADVRATSARWAWVEHVLAQGGEAEGLAVLEAARAGGSFRDYQRAFERAAPKDERRSLAVLPLA